MEKKVLYKEDSKSLEKLVGKYIKSDLIEVCCKDGIIVIFSKNLQCSTCWNDDESKIIKHGDIYMCEECIERMGYFAERTWDEESD